MSLRVSPELTGRYTGLGALLVRARGVKVERSTRELEKFKGEIIQEIRGKYRLEALKDAPIIRAYRDFFWRVGIDPTKIRPAAEALIRRVLSGKSLPSINNVVDAYNLASMKTEIALAAFDEDRLQGELLMRVANKGERFLGIGMAGAKELQGGEIVVSDAVKLVAIYPYRDAEESKVMEETKNVLLMSCGVPGISAEDLLRGAHVAQEYVTRFCGGSAT